MGISILKNAFVSINGVDLSDHVKSVKLDVGAKLEDSTSMSDNTEINIAGLKSWSADVEFVQDFATSSVDATLFPLIGAAAFTIILRPDAGAVSTSNPNYTGLVVMDAYSPLGNSVGDLATTNATFKSAGDISRATA